MIAIQRLGIVLGLAWLGLPPAADATAATIGAGLARRQEAKADIELPELLRKAAAYCRKLEKSVLDFIAIEEIEEIIDTTLDGTPSAKVVTDWREAPFAREMSVRPSAFKNAMVYDYPQHLLFEFWCHLSQALRVPFGVGKPGAFNQR